VTKLTVCTTCAATREPRSRHGLCLRCDLRQLSSAVLDDGHGRVDARLIALHDGLCATTKAHNAIRWLANPDVVARLRAIVGGDVALTHHGIDTLVGASLGREYLRDMLVARGVLPTRDKYLAAFERWSTGRLERIADDDHRQIIRAYLHWGLHRRLRARSEIAPLNESAAGLARQQTNVAIDFLTWLARRGRGLSECRQQDIDVWFAAGPTTRWALRNFLAWAIDTRRCARLRVPHYQGRRVDALDRTARLTILKRLFTDTSIELSDRVAGCLVLLYAQPLARIRNITIDDIDQRDDGTWLRITHHHVPVPEPAGTLTTELATHARRNLATMHNPTSPWLFPGRAAGQPIQAEQLGERLARLGVTRGGRLSALNGLVAEIPAPILGQLIGYSPNIIAEHARSQGVEWAAYAALKSRELGP
jgi:hypothetical protein